MLIVTKFCAVDAARGFLHTERPERAFSVGQLPHNPQQHQQQSPSLATSEFQDVALQVEGNHTPAEREARDKVQPEGELL